MSKSTKYYIDAKGDRVPARYLSEYEKQRDKIARQIEKEWRAEKQRLRNLRTKTVERIEKLQAMSRKDNDAKDLGGEQGNVQFRSHDGTITITLDNAKRTEFDERLSLAQELIMSAVKDLSAGEHNADLVEIATRAFQPRRSGSLDMQRVRDLRNYRVKHPDWRKAVKIISECERCIGHRRYVRVTVRPNQDSRPEPIVLDISRV